jgi:hypothetical protein
MPVGNRLFRDPYRFTSKRPGFTLNAASNAGGIERSTRLRPHLSAIRSMREPSVLVLPGGNGPEQGAVIGSADPGWPDIGPQWASAAANPAVCPQEEGQQLSDG